MSHSGKIIVIYAAVIIVLVAGCTGLRKIDDGRHLYTGQSVHFDSSQYLEKVSETRTELEGLISEKPNTKLLWMRPYLCLHNMMPEPKKEKGFRYWLKYKLGEKPVLIEDINLPDINSAVVNRMQNRGNFGAASGFKVITKQKTAKVVFHVSPGKPYILRSIDYPVGSMDIQKEIHALLPGSLLKGGQVYNLSRFENERIRIDKILKDRGYYYFRPDYLIFTADTFSLQHNINVRLGLKPDIPAGTSSAYKVNDIYIFDDYSLRDYHPDTTRVGELYYISEKQQFKPQTILDAISFEKDSLYSRTVHYNTLRKLMGLGVYKFANARFVTFDSLPGKMNVNVMLTPARKQSLSADIDAAVKSNSFTGPGLNLNYKNRNLLHGAELLTVTLGGRVEVQYSGESKGQLSYEVTLDASLALPRIVPFRIRNSKSGAFIPKTIINAGGGAFLRVDLYRLNSFNASLGYKWKSGESTSHFLKLIEADYTNLVESSAEFEEYLQENPTVRKSFEEQFIIGTSYNFVIHNLNRPQWKHAVYLDETIDLAGNLTSLFTTLANGSRPTPENQHELLGLAYSQFIRIRNEIRYFYHPSKKSEVAYRLIMAAGVPYGNSSTIPYVRQYFVGGTNSLRSFIARTIGPGTYHPPDSLSSINIDQAGDIKFETNFEYRFDIIKYFKGAIFVDAGNIWLVNEDEQRPGGKFDIDTFLSEFAMGSGFGFRFDFSYIVLRFDLAFPLRKPYLPPGERWVFSDIDLGSPSWRRENIIWNFAIGYPF